MMSAPPARLRVAFAMREGLREEVFSPAARDRLEACADVDPNGVFTNVDSDEARDRLAHVDVLLTCWGAPLLDAEVLDVATDLRAVVHAAGSVRHHLTDEVWQRGIAVSSAAHANAVPVAEFTLAAILFAGKRVLPFAAELRHDPGATDVARWPEVGNYGKRVGILGASRIGRLVCDLLKPFAVDIVICDPFLDDVGAAALGARLVSIDELCATSDIVTIHAPELPETHHVIGADELAAMPDGATLINTARGSLVDHEALLPHVVSGRLNAVLDVTTPEPLPADSPLLHLPNVLVTPHVAGSLGTELFRLGDAAVDEVERLAGGLPLRHPVRLADLGHIA